MNYMDYDTGMEMMEGENLEPDTGQEYEETAEEGAWMDEQQESEAEETGSETQEKPKRGRKKKDDQSEDVEYVASGNSVQEPDDHSGEAESDINEGPDENGGAYDDLSEGTEGSGDVDSSVPRRAARRRRASVLDGEGNVTYERGDTGQHDLQMLAAAANSRTILSATLDGFEADGISMPKAVFYVGSVKVMIPFREMGFDLNADDTDPIEARLQINGMLGAKIFYMVRGVDMENRVAGASRRDAMLLRQRTILNARQGDGFRIRIGTKCMAQMLHVSRRFVRVEIYGMETYIYIGDISNLWVNDIREEIHVGEERPVEIVELTRDEQGRATSIRVSLKLAEEAPLQELQRGNTYTGTITGYSETAYFVKVAGVPLDIRCPIKSNHTMELMEQGDLVKFFVPAIYDGRPTGAILKILKKARNFDR